MAEVEITSRRGATSRTFALDDGTRRIEIGGGVANHLKNGVWVPTDTTWQDLLAEYSTGEHPWTVSLNKSNWSITVSDGTDTVTLDPVNTRVPQVSASGNTVTFEGLWRGVTAYCVLTPEHFLIEFTRTATNYTDPSIRVTGDATPMLDAHYETETGNVTVPATLSSGVVTYDLSAVPIGAVVR